MITLENLPFLLPPVAGCRRDSRILDKSLTPDMHAAWKKRTIFMLLKSCSRWRDRLQCSFSFGEQNFSGFVDICSLDIFKDRKVLLWITLVLTYLRTSHLPYKSSTVQVIFRRSHPTLKPIKQKMSEIIQVNVPNFFHFDEIPKMTKLGPKNRFWDLKI